MRRSSLYVRASRVGCPTRLASSLINCSFRIQTFSLFHLFLFCLLLSTLLIVIRYASPLICTYALFVRLRSPPILSAPTYICLTTKQQQNYFYAFDYYTRAGGVGGVPAMIGLGADEDAFFRMCVEIQRNREFYKNADVRPPFTYASLIRQVSRPAESKGESSIANMQISSSSSISIPTTTTGHYRIA